jgi:hypothetical protein
MPDDDQAPEPVPDSSPPFAWQPLTPRGVAAFARASLGRVLLVQLAVASLAAGAVVWFLAHGWFPTVRQAIRQLPEQGSIRNGQLVSTTQRNQILAQTNFLMIVIDLETERNATQTSDVLVEFHKSNFQICSLFGCFQLNYPANVSLEFNRPKLAPWWDAWEPTLLGITGLLVILWLLSTWAVLATMYCGVVRLLGFFRDRDLDWRASWRLASAALLPGALLFTGGIAGYLLGVVDLVRLLLLFGVHFVVGWIYLLVSPLFVVRIAGVLPARANPFVNQK